MFPFSSTTNGQCAHAEGYYTSALAPWAHAEGIYTQAGERDSNNNYTGGSAHAEGSNTKAIGNYSHAEGIETTASGTGSHAEGYRTTASENQAHAEGYSTTASGNQAHAEGANSVSSGYCSHAEGHGTIANKEGQHVVGRWNIADPAGSGSLTYFEIVGNGSSDSNRVNIRTLDYNGNERISGSYLQISDQRYKDECGEVPDMSMIQARRYKWNDKKPVHDDKEHLGYFAQDVEAIAPYLISEDETGYKSLDYNGVFVAKIAALERRIAELEKKLSEKEV